MRIDDMYPDSFDASEASKMPPMAGGQDDPVLDTLKYARNRVADDWTCQSYITHRGAVCAYGGVFVAPNSTGDGVSAAGRLDSMNIAQFIEKELSDVAREAIQLLNEAAIELYPEAEAYGDWNGPLEYLNQQLLEGDYEGDDENFEDEVDYKIESDPRRARVLEAYDRAIARREGLLV